jgi:hypothetical protein
MQTRRLAIPAAVLLFAAWPAYAGCGSCSKHAENTKCRSKCGLCAFLAGKCGHKAVKASCEPTQSRAVPEGLPPSGAPGECFTKVFVPAQFKTVSERVMIKPASEKFEIIPAEYKWEEQRVCVKEATKQIVEVPAEYRTEEHRVCVKPAHSGWVLERKTNCNGDDKPRDVYCYVSTPAEYKTISTQILVKPACTRTETIPAQYDTVRRQVVATPARTRKICVPAEYADQERSVMVADATFKWERIVCEDQVSAKTVNRVKSALTAAGYTPGPMDGKLAAADWNALTQFQQKHGLGVGELSYETLQKLGVSLK